MVRSSCCIWKSASASSEACKLKHACQMQLFRRALAVSQRAPACHASLMEATATHNVMGPDACAKEMQPGQQPSLQLVSNIEVEPTTDCRGLPVYQGGNAAWAARVTAGVQH